MKVWLARLFLTLFCALVGAGTLPVRLSAAAVQQTSQDAPKIIRKSGGVLQATATRKVEPAYPPLAKAARVSGYVVVEVTVDEEGGVVAARAVSGHPLLKDAAVAAARQWTFQPTSLSGEAIKVIGTLTFNFELPDENGRPLYHPSGLEGELVGTVRFDGLAPEPRRIDMGYDRVCVETGSFATQDVLVTNGKLANVLVYVDGGQLSEYRFPTPSNARVLSRLGCQFVPRVIGLQTNQTLRIENGDSTTHNTHPAPKINVEWNMSQPPGSASIERWFSRPELMIPVKCNQHPWEKAYIGVLAHPFFAVTDAQGAFKMTGLPPGEYSVIAWHEAFGDQRLQISVGERETKTLDIRYGQ